MDDASRYVIDFLETFATCNSRLVELAVSLQFHPQVLKVLNSLECRQYQTGSIIEGYVDTKLKNGKSVCWWLEVEWQNECWLIDNQILVNDSKGQFTAHQFAKRTSIELKQFLTQLMDATQELVQFDALELKEVKE